MKGTTSSTSEQSLGPSGVSILWAKLGQPFHLPFSIFGGFHFLVHFVLRLGRNQEKTKSKRNIKGNKLSSKAQQKTVSTIPSTLFVQSSIYPRLSLFCWRPGMCSFSALSCRGRVLKGVFLLNLWQQLVLQQGQVCLNLPSLTVPPFSVSCRATVSLVLQSSTETSSSQQKEKKKEVKRPNSYWNGLSAWKLSLKWYVKPLQICVWTLLYWFKIDYIGLASTSVNLHA